MEEQQFLTTKDVLGYAEEYIVVEERNELLNYSLSNNLDDIKKAIYTRTGCNIDLDNAHWIINHGLSVSVKNLMNKHHVTYSMTTLYEEEDKRICIIVNMSVGDKWFITRFNKVKDKGGFIFNYEKYLIFMNTLDLADDPYNHRLDDVLG